MPCGGKYSTFPETLTVSEGSALELSLTISINNLARVNTSYASGATTDCVDGSGVSVCIGYPNAVAYVGSQAPSITTFMLSKDSNGTLADASMEVLVLKDSDSKVIGALTKRIYKENADPAASLFCANAQSLHTVSLVSGNKYSLSTGDSPATMLLSPFDVTDSHTGEMSCGINGPYPYKAYLQP